MFILAESITDVTASQFAVFIGCVLILLMIVNHSLDFVDKIKSIFGLENNKEATRTEKRLDSLEILTNAINLKLAEISAALRTLHNVGKKLDDHSLAIAKIEAKGCTYRETCLNQINHPKPEK